MGPALQCIDVINHFRAFLVLVSVVVYAVDAQIDNSWRDGFALVYGVLVCRRCGGHVTSLKSYDLIVPTWIT